MTINSKVRVEYERFACEVSYTCPECGTKSYCELDHADVRWLQDDFVCWQCAECGKLLKLTDR